MDRLSWDLQAMVAHYLPIRNGFELIKSRRLKPTCCWDKSDNGKTVCRISHGHSLRWCRRFAGRPKLRDAEHCDCTRCCQSRYSQWQHFKKALQRDSALRMDLSRRHLQSACEDAKRRLGNAPALGYCHYLRSTMDISPLWPETLKLKLADGRTVTVTITEHQIYIR